MSTRTAVVTGAASGIGAATARKLLDDGYRVLGVDIAELPDGVTPIRGDVTEEATWAAIGEVDALVSNAYVPSTGPLHEIDRAEWRRQLDVNLTGAYLAVKACLPSLRARGGAIVLVSSVHAHFGLPGHPAYAASKGALVALARQLAVEYAPAVRVNSVLPGPVLTEAWSRISPEDRERSARATPAGRLGELGRGGGRDRLPALGRRVVRHRRRADRRRRLVRRQGFRMMGTQMGDTGEDHRG